VFEKGTDTTSFYFEKAIKIADCYPKASNADFLFGWAGFWDCLNLFNKYF